MDKHAYEASVMMVLEKRAGMVSEETGRYIGNAVGSLLGGLPITEGGAVVGYFPEVGGRAEVEKLNAYHDAVGLIPGYGSYLNTRRTINTDAAFGDKSPRAREVANDIARNIGGLPLLYIPNLVATVAAAITKRRTDEEQRKASTSSKWKYLIPGYATYDRYKPWENPWNLQKIKRKKVKTPRIRASQRIQNDANKKPSPIKGGFFIDHDLVIYKAH